MPEVSLPHPSASAALGAPPSVVALLSLQASFRHGERSAFWSWNIQV